MANEQNLKPFTERTKSEQREISRKGGIASGEARRRKKEFRELFESILSEDGGAVNGQKVTRKEAIATKAITILISNETSTSEFLRAFEIVRDTIGERPIERIAMTDIDQDTINEVETMVMSNDKETSD